MSKVIFILYVFIFCFNYSSNSQNQKILFITPNIEDNCNCKEISDMIVEKMTPLFDKRIEYYTWELASSVEKRILRDGANFILTSTLKKDNFRDYKITFLFKDLAENIFDNVKFEQLIDQNKYEIAINDLFDIIKKEIEYFKENKKFKVIVELDDFKITNDVDIKLQIEQVLKDYMSHITRKLNRYPQLKHDFDFSYSENYKDITYHIKGIISQSQHSNKLYLTITISTIPSSINNIHIDIENFDKNLESILKKIHEKLILLEN